MDNSRTNESFTSEEKGGNIFSLDLIAEAVKKAILANAGEQGVDKEQAFQENNYFDWVLSKVQEIRGSKYDARRKIVEVAAITIDFDHSPTRINTLLKRCKSNLSEDELNGFADFLLLSAEGMAKNHLVISMHYIDWILSEYCKHNKRSLTEVSRHKQLSEMMKQKGDLEIKLERMQRQKADLEMQLSETRKLLDNVVKKSPDEGIIKAIQTYVTHSKHKTPDKRAHIQGMVLEFANINGLLLPEELRASIANLDNEQAEPKVMSINGDIVHNKHVENEVNYVAAGATGIKTKSNN